MYKPTHLTEWKRPDSYFGAEWYGWYPVYGRHRDSDLLTNTNFEVIRERLMPLSTEIEDVKNGFPSGEVVITDSVACVEESHWAVGWVQWIGVHESNEAALRVADEIKKALDGYPVVDEDRWSERETEEMEKAWYDVSLRERIRLCADAGASIFAARGGVFDNDAVYDYLREYVNS